MKTRALIVLFNKILSESLTYSSLSNYSNIFDEIIVYNNGPDLIDESENSLPHNFKLVNDLTNKPLSEIYNEFVSCDGFDRFIILDDDSTITESYINSFLNEANVFDIGMPLIKSNHNGDIYYPVVSKISDIFHSTYDFSERTYTISSGLVLSSELILLVKNKFGSVFDERFSLYGVDISFFFRIDQISKERKIKCLSSGYIIHDLSKFSSEVSSFRAEELLIDQILQYKLYHRNKKRILIHLIKNRKGLSKIKMSGFIKAVKSFLSGKHPRSRFNSEK